MCGIAGILSNEFENTEKISHTIDIMTKSIAHRGPNDQGKWIGCNVALGHVRLSIIDLTSAAHQPMSSQDGSIRIVFNGEIYNYRDLRSELIELGYFFKSNSDTEVILNGYHHYGESIFQKLRGMFALAIWDGRNDTLIIARDRVGKKPLFYAWDNGVFLFGSEIKAILAWPGFKREPNYEAIHHFLTLQYVPAPYSAFNNIRKLPQASYMIINREGKSNINKYWCLPQPSQVRIRPVNELKEECLELLDESVRIRMISDVPIGAFLSGGVDSSAVVALMARHSSNRVKTFCIGFEDVNYDERIYARKVASHLGTDHHELIVQPEAIEILPKIVWHYNEPFADPSAIPTFYLSYITSQNVTVALNGDGGDESFLGYGRYSQCLKSEWISTIPESLRRLVHYIVRSIPSNYDKLKIIRGLRLLASLLSEKNSRRYAPSMAYFYDSDKIFGYGNQLEYYLDYSSLDLLEYYFRQSKSYIGGAAWTDIHTYLPDDLLVKVDIASMAYGLEARSPFLDHKLMEWAASIPPKQKIVNGITKSILKSVMEPLLPRDILYRSKMGFGVPIDEWIRGSLKEFFYDTLLSSKSKKRGLIKEEYIELMLNEHCNGIRLHHTRLWALIMLELWFEIWIDAPHTPMTAPSGGLNI